MAKNILTTGAISSYFDLQLELDVKVDDLLQVLKIDEKDLYCICCLSDSIHTFDQFFLPRNIDIKIKQYDIININLITYVNRNKKGFMIKKCKLYENATSMIGSPTSFGSSSNQNNNTNNNNNLNSNSSNMLHVNGNVNGNRIGMDSKTSNNNASNMKTKEVKPAIASHPKKSDKNYTPLSRLNTFTRDVEILVRVIDKSEFKKYTNEKGNGSLFNLLVMDCEGSQIQVTAFNRVAEKYYNQVTEGKIYEIIGGFVKINSKRFNTANSEYQLTLNDTSLISEVIDNHTIPAIKHKLEKLGNLNNIQLHSSIDCLGYVVEVSEKSKVSTKNGELLMRKVYIVDESEYKVELALWKKNAEVEYEQGDILLIKNATVSQFQGRNISASDSTKITKNPITMREASELSKWAANFKGQFKSYVPEKNEEKEGEEINKTSIVRLSEVLKKFDTSRNVSYDELSKFYTIVGIVSFLQHSDKNIYSGCPVKKCKKKLVEEDVGYYYCNACKIQVKVPAYYMTLSLRVKDTTKEHWIDLFGSVAEKFLGLTADEYREYIISNNQERLSSITKNLEFNKFYFLIRVKATVFNNISKKKINAYRVERIDIKEETARLLQELENI
jgi:replication factor A1